MTMRRGMWVLASVALLTGCAGMGSSYQTPAAAGQIPFTVEPITPQLVNELRAIAPPLSSPPPGTPDPTGYVYRIGVGDVLAITLNQSIVNAQGGSSGDPLAEGAYIVGEDGKIFLPLHGPITVIGMTLGEAYAVIRSALGRFVNRPEVNVRIGEHRSQRFAVAGEIGKPGYFPITDRPVTITEAILLATPGESADLRKVVLKRKGVDYPVDAYALMKSAGFGQQWVLVDGDVIVVPRNENKVYVLGEAPNRFELIDPYSTSLAQLLVPLQNPGATTQLNSNYLQAGSAQPGSIFVIRGNTESAKVYHLNGTAPEAFIIADGFQMAGGDIVFVSARPITRFNRFVAQLLPSLQSVVAPVFIANQIDQLGSER